MNIKQYFGANIEFSEHEDLVLGIEALVLSKDLSGAEVDCLYQAWNKGLMESGDTPSKEGRAGLLRKGVLCQTCWDGSDYTFSVTYPFGHKVIQALAIKW